VAESGGQCGLSGRLWACTASGGRRAPVAARPECDQSACVRVESPVEDGAERVEWGVTRLPAAPDKATITPSVAATGAQQCAQVVMQRATLTQLECERSAAPAAAV